VTEYIAQVVKQGKKYRVALIPVSYRGGSPIVAAAWAEQDFGIFEAATQAEAEAFVGQLSERIWMSDQSHGFVLPMPPGCIKPMDDPAPPPASKKVRR